MRQWKLPGTDLWLSGIVMGTGNFNPDHAAENIRMLDHFAELDGNVIDTANRYGKLRTSDPNHAEQIVGQWLRKSSQAANMAICTKGGFPELEDPANSRLTAHEVTEDLDLSLSTLGRERIDVYDLHRDDPDIPVAELIGILRNFRDQGKIRYYGLSNWSPDRLREALAIDRQQAQPGLVAVQNRWSLVRYNDQAADDPNVVSMDWETWELADREKLAIMPYSSMGKGYFSKYLQNTSEVTEKLRRYYENDLNKQRAAALKKLHKETGYSISQLVLAWLMHQPMPVFPVVAFNRLDQLHDAVEAAGLNLSRPMLEALGAGEPW
jgi:aryl-alcohol dehydrogenase-like predicted oxidoreductase